VLDVGHHGQTSWISQRGAGAGFDPALAFGDGLSGLERHALTAAQFRCDCPDPVFAHLVFWSHVSRSLSAVLWSGQGGSRYIRRFVFHRRLRKFRTSYLVAPKRPSMYC